jgi:acyl-CoA hydrolase/rubrerythrin
MELKGSKTEEVLKEALYLELFQDFKYRCFADVARQTDQPQIAEMFETIADNEREHAHREYHLLGGPGDVTKNLQHAAYSEHELVTDFYPKAAAIADKEGFKEIAEFFNRIIPVEKRHEDSFIDLELGLQKGTELEGRTVSHSAVEMAQLMLPAQANPAGFVHGGELMKLMDNAAGVVAARHAHSNVVTAQVEDIVFKSPVLVGSLVIVKAKLVFTSRSSMQIRVDIEVESISQERRVPALTANFIMVAVDSAGKPAKIPQLIRLAEEEEKLFDEAEKRYKARKK